jgi:hypothetical protein
MLLLKRNRVALDRDVIFLAESGEEADTSGVGINFITTVQIRRIAIVGLLKRLGKPHPLAR